MSTVILEAARGQCNLPLKGQKDFTSAKSFCYVNDYFLSAIAAFAFAAIFAAVRP